MVLSTDSIHRFNIGDKWFQFGRSQALSVDMVEKLLAPEISLGGNFTYDKNGQFYSTTTVYGYIKKKEVIESYQCLQAIMNSKLCWWFLLNTGTVLSNGYFRYKPNYIKPFPIPGNVETTTALKLTELVNLVSITDLDKKIKQDIEKQIDNIVYDLYNLNDYEKNAINNSVYSS